MVTFSLSALLFSPQSSLTKFAESLQEMINYHTVCYRCHVKPDILSFFCLPPPRYSWVMTKLSWADGLEQLLNCQTFYLLLGRTAADHKREEMGLWEDGLWLDKGKQCIRSILWRISNNVRVPLTKPFNLQLCSRGYSEVVAIISGFQVGFHISVKMWSRVLLKMCLHAQQTLPFIKSG